MEPASFISQWSFNVAELHAWKIQLHEVVEVLQATAGFEELTVLHSPDETERYVVQCQWSDVGSYRRGISSTRAKLVIWPFLSTMIDLPSAFETLLIATDSDVTEFDSSVEG